MPRVHEAFYASWRAPKTTKPVADSTWRVTHPLTFDGEVVGKLDIVGLVDDHERSTLSQIAQVLDFLEPIEDEVREVKRSLLLSRAPKKNDTPVILPEPIDPLMIDPLSIETKTLEPQPLTTSLAAH